MFKGRKRRFFPANAEKNDFEHLKQQILTI